MVYVSPGVYTREQDFSLYAPALATTIFGMVGSASKGPTEEITLITDEAALVNTFGEPSSSHYGLLAAVRYLRRGRQLKFVRVATGDATAAITIPDDSAYGTSLTCTAVSSGSWGNLITIRISAGSRVAGTFKLTVLYNGVVAEVFDNLVCGLSSVSDTRYVETVINSVSGYITVVDNTDFDGAASGDFVLISGLDGTTAYTDIIGEIVGNTSTGLQLFRNAENVDVNLLAAPGFAQRQVVAELIDICETRGDAMALLAVPYGKTVSQAVDWHNGSGGGANEPTAALNSSYAALYYPWVEVYDGWSDSDLWLPAEGHAAAVMAFTDYNYDPWIIPAGLTRGRLTDALDVEYSPNQGDRDYLNGEGNAINPIVNFSSDGVVIYGNRTLQRATTALDRIHVRRMLLYARKVIATATRYLVFEPNDSFTWKRFINLVTPVLDSIRSRRGITRFQVICDATTNTAAVINRNEMAGKILIIPTKGAEAIEIDFTLLAAGANFSEFA